MIEDGIALSEKEHRSMATYKISDLDDKVAYVVGCCEFLHIRQMLIKKSTRGVPPSQKSVTIATQQNAIAEHLLVSASQWSRMKTGKEAISNIQLARLSEYFDVDRSFDFLIWTKPVEKFRTALNARGYGRLRRRAAVPNLKEFLDSRTLPDENVLRIVVVNSPSSKRGIGAFADGAPSPVELRDGDHVRIAVTGKAGLSHLVLLSWEPEGQFTVLAPLKSKTPAKADGPETLLPRGRDTYPVGRPIGHYMLYAVLSKTTLGLENHLSFATPFPTLSNAEEDALRDEITAHSEVDPRVYCLPYEVVR